MQAYRQGRWTSSGNEAATIFEIDLSEGQLTVALATKAEVETVWLYRRIEVDTGKDVCTSPQQLAVLRPSIL